MASELAAGDRAPDFHLPAAGGRKVKLSDFRGRKLVLYFYPRADTPGCTREAIDFSRLIKSFAKADTDIVGVSADPVKAQDAFAAKHALKIPLASDETHRMLADYGVWGKKSMYGKSFMGIRRSTFLIDVNGQIAHIWRNVKVDGHAEQVLTAAKAL